MAASKVSLKLLIDKKGKKVLFAEAGKDFVDFLFYILSLPVGTVIRLLTKQGMVGCLPNLYESIENLNETYLQPNQNKETILKPKSPICATDVPLLLLDNTQTSKKFYRCNNNYNHSYVTDDRRAVCPSCRSFLSNEITYVPVVATEVSGGGGGGFVKGVVTYMVMDDLVVKPMSTISSITMLNNFNVKEVGVLEERVVEMEMAEGLKLLQESLQSKTVLTRVFLSNMENRDATGLEAATELMGE